MSAKRGRTLSLFGDVASIRSGGRKWKECDPVLGDVLLSRRNDQLSALATLGAHTNNARICTYIATAVLKTVRNGRQNLLYSRLLRPDRLQLVVLSVVRLRCFRLAPHNPLVSKTFRSVTNLPWPTPFQPDTRRGYLPYCPLDINDHL